MIFDYIKNANLYYSLGEKIQKALEYLETTDFKTIEPGLYEIQGTDVYATITDYASKPLSAGKWEAHRKYIDVQYVVSGIEKIGFTEFKKVMLLEEYDAVKDFAIYKGDGSFINVEEKHFCIFFPTDIHMPGIAIHIPKPVRKVVVKVSVDELEQIPDNSQPEEVKDLPEENQVS